jgi:hypothetical protein
MHVGEEHAGTIGKAGMVWHETIEKRGTPEYKVNAQE